MRIEFASEMNMELWKSYPFSNGLSFVTNSYSRSRFSPHFHDHYVIMAIERGVNEGVCNRHNYQVTQDDILFLNPGEIHTGNSYLNKPLRYSGMYIEQDFFKQPQFEFMTGYSSIPWFKQTVIRESRTAAELLRLITISKEPADLFEFESMFVTVFGKLMRYTSPFPALSADSYDAVYMRKIERFIYANYERNFSLFELSQSVNLSPFHMIRLFKKQTGITPHQFLRNYRIEKAKKMLIKKRSITDVALSVGFFDQSHFHKYFRLITGITPRDFLKVQL